MNLSNLFEVQKKLDARIVEEKGLQGQDLLDKKILALQVELGELANELPEVFKFWSNKKNNYERALKEYVDCLHFILSIGNDIGFSDYHLLGNYQQPATLTEMFSLIFSEISVIGRILSNGCDQTTLKIGYIVGFGALTELGEMLGFTWEQIEDAYYAKNKINHERQANGY